MKLPSATLVLVMVVAGALASDAVRAHGKGQGRSRGGRPAAVHSHHHHHHHARSGVFAGAVVAAPAVWPRWYGPPYHSPGAPVYYIERADQAGGEWLYCPAVNVYFPHVSE